MWALHQLDLVYEVVMSNITGRAKRYDGSAIDYAMLYDWDKGYSIAKITPNASGVWSYGYYRDMKIGIAYVADGCEPITHGPYIFVAEWSPLILFEGGVKGVFYDPSDVSTMFQDAAGSTPVTAHGQPVGLIKDKSGNNLHARQTALNARPIYQTDGILHWLYFDGVDDFLVADYKLISTKHVIAASTNVLIVDDANHVVLDCYNDSWSDSLYRSGSRFILRKNSIQHEIGSVSARHIIDKVYTGGKVYLLSRVNDKNVTYFVNNSSQSATHSSVMVPNKKTYIGVSSQGQEYAKMNFYGALVLERNISELELTEVKDYMAHTVGLPSA